MKKLRLNSAVRNLIIIILIFAIIIASYVNYSNYQSSLPHEVSIGTGLAYISCSTSGILYSYPYGKSAVIGNTTTTQVFSYIGISTFAILYDNDLYNTTIVYNQSYYFLKLTKELFIKTNVTRIQYNVFLEYPYYTKLVYSNFSLSGIIPLNLSYLMDLSNEINNETGVSSYPTISIVINSSALINITTINGNIFSVKLVKNYIGKDVEKPLYGKLVSLSSYPQSDLYMLYIDLGFYPNLTEGNYSIVLQLFDLNLTLTKGKLNSTIPLNLTQIYRLAENLTSTYRLEPTTPLIYIYMKAKLGNFTLYPYLIINDSNGNITTTMYNNSYYYPIYVVVHSSYSYIELLYVLIPSIFLALVLIFTENKVPNVKDNILKKYGKIIIQVEKAEFNNAKIIRVKDFNELLKVSKILSKPILFHENKMWIEDYVVIYLLEI